VLFGNPDKASPLISPDGKYLAYLAPDEGVLNVWVRSVEKADDQVVTSDRKRGIRFFLWQGDSAHVLYLQDFDGDENFHLYQTNLASKNTRDLTPFLGVQATVVAVDPNIPNEVLVMMNLRDRHFHDVYRINLINGATELEVENPGDVVAFGADNKMEIRTAHAFLPDGQQELRVRAGSKHPWQTLQRWSVEDTVGGIVGFAPDNQHVLIISSVGVNAARLVEADPVSGNFRVIAEDREYDAGDPLRHPRTHVLEAIQFTRARTEWTVIDPSIQPDFDVLKSVRDGDFEIVSRDLNDRTWIVAFLVDDGPIYYYTYDRASKRATLLFTNRPVLEQYPLAKMQPVSFPARDGLQLHGYLTLPVGVEPKKLALVLLVHGGPWGRDEWGFDPQCQLLANRGYAVLQVNFRGSTGYGKAHINAGNKEWAGRMHDDLLDAKQWAIAQGFADPARVAIMGGSYGGYATLVGLAFTPEEFCCGVDVVGPSNLVTLLTNPPPYWLPFMAFIHTRLGHPVEDKDFLEARSPLFKAERIVRPLLIAQGANDPRVKKAESDQIVEAMRRNRKEVEYLLFPDEGHGFRRPENNLKFMAAAEAFLARHLGGRCEPAKESDWASLRN
jgi:dipeptidyl aminopeptidase/acylaminoacyl peptidase